MRCSGVPVLLAMSTGYSSDVEDFDLALFGRKWGGYQKQLKKIVESGYTPDGILNHQKNQAPTYAGVLAFLCCRFQ